MYVPAEIYHRFRTKPSPKPAHGLCLSLLDGHLIVFQGMRNLTICELGPRLLACTEYFACCSYRHRCRLSSLLYYIVYIQMQLHIYIYVYMYRYNIFKSSFFFQTFSPPPVTGLGDALTARLCGWERTPFRPLPLHRTSTLSALTLSNCVNHLQQPRPLAGKDRRQSHSVHSKPSQETLHLPTSQSLCDSSPNPLHQPSLIDHHDPPSRSLRSLCTPTSATGLLRSARSGTPWIWRSRRSSSRTKNTIL